MAYFCFSDKEHITEQIFNNPDDNEIDTTSGAHDKIPFQVYCVNCKKMQVYKGVWDKERKNYGIYCQVIYYNIKINLIVY